MLVRAPLVEAEQDGSIRIQDLTKVVVARRRLGLAKERQGSSRNGTDDRAEHAVGLGEDVELAGGVHRDVGVGAAVA
jgi:hypothetical protein